MNYPAFLVSVKNDADIRTDEDMIMIFLAIILAAIVITAIIWIFMDNKKKTNKSQTTPQNTAEQPANSLSNEHACEACGEPTTKDYRLCPKCFDLMQNDQVKACKNCGKFYQIGKICSCVKQPKKPQK